MRISSKPLRYAVCGMLGIAMISLTLVTALAADKTYVPPAGGWSAFFKTDKGEVKPIVQPIEKNKDKDWMFLQFTDFTGPKNRLAVMRVENKTANVEQADNTKNTTLWTGHVAEVPVAAIEELMTTAFVNCHRFKLLERKALDQTLAEQDFANSGRVAQPSAAKIGKMLGAQFLIYTAVNEWTPEKGKVSGGGGGIGGGFLGGLGASKSDAEVAMSFRIVDATTGEVMTALTERATAGSWGLGVGAGGYGGGGAGGGMIGIEKNSPVSYAVQSCINKACYKIAMALADRPWSGAVMKVSGGKIYVNAGSDSGIVAGMSLNAMSKGEELVDPETGMSLGSEMKPIGTLQVIEVQEKYSIAQITNGCKGLKVGDVLQMIK